MNRSRIVRTAAAFACGLPSALSMHGQTATANHPVALPEYVVSVARTPQETSALPIAVRIIPAEHLASATAVDEALRADPAFNLLRRTSSLSAHPTAQGVSLRGVGPSGASRTAVLYDDLPLNDPFGGWIVWSQLPTLSLARAEIAHGGGSGLWGNTALGGTVALVSTPLREPGGAVALEIGSDAFRRAELMHTALVGDDAWRIDGRYQDYGGFYALRSRDRGAVDRPLKHRHRLAQIKWRHAVGRETDAIFAMRVLDEDRVNGTQLQVNSTQILHASTRLEGRESGKLLWTAAAWGQWQDYASFFSAVSEDRMHETPANDQYAVPSKAAGLLANRVFENESGHTVLGVDGRWVEGETRENYLYRDGAFAQRRFAGGAQHAAGVFAHHDRRLGAAVHLSGALRVDAWAGRDGHTLESSLGSGAITRNDRHPDETGIELSPRLGVSIQSARDTLLRAAIYRGFRQPTLNEYHRPFRVGNTTTLANPALKIETLDGLDLGIEHRLGKLQLSAGLFWNRMHDAVGNVTLSSGPTGTTRQRQNLEETVIRGVELTAQWQVTDTVDIRAAGLAVDAEVTHARAQPSLVGRAVPQVPEYVMNLAMSWRFVPPTRITSELRAVGRQFEDDENLLPLKSAWTVNLRIEQRLSTAATAFLDIRDVFDRPAQTSRNAAGLITYDQPRSVRGGVRFSW